MRKLITYIDLLACLMGAVFFIIIALLLHFNCTFIALSVLCCAYNK